MIRRAAVRPRSADKPLQSPRTAVPVPATTSASPIPAFALAALERLPGVGVLGFDREMRFVIATGDVLRGAGYRPELMLGRTLADIVPAAAYTGLRHRYDQILSGEAVTWIQRAPDDRREYVVDGAPVRQGAVVRGGILSIRAVDAGERLESERLRAVVALQNEIAASGLQVDAVMELVARRAAELTGADAGVVELPDGDEMVYRAVSGTASAHLGLRLRIDSSLSGLALTAGTVAHCDDATTDPRVNAEACRRVGALSMLCVPLRYGEAPIGILKVYSARIGAFAASDAEMLGHLSGVIGAQMRHADLYTQRTFESHHDGLTGLRNRRAYDAWLDEGGASPSGEALILFDLDGFKGLNDRQGHPAGDAALAAVGEVLRGLRGSDVSHRIGGDEFAVVVAGVTADRAHRIADRIRERIAASAAAAGTVTASAGVAMVGGADRRAAHAAADAALLAAKRARPRR